MPAPSTYILLRNYDIPPPPTGPLELGTILFNIQYDYTKSIICNIPPHTSEVKNEEKAPMTQNQGLLQKARLTFTSATTSFEPDSHYLDHIMQHSELQRYFENTHFSKNAYLITGLKVARNVEFLGKQSSTTIPSEFVFGIRLAKISPRKISGNFKMGLEMNLGIDGTVSGVPIGIAPETSARISEPQIALERVSADLQARVWTGSGTSEKRSIFACIPCMSEPTDEAARQRRELRKALEKYALDD